MSVVVVPMMRRVRQVAAIAGNLARGPRGLRLWVCYWMGTREEQPQPRVAPLAP